MRSFVVLFLLVLASSAASLRAQSVAFAWEGERAPLERERYFYAGDWPAMRPLIAKVRSVGKPNGFVPCAFSTYLKVPDDGRTRCVARFLTGAGPGLRDNQAMMLVVRPAPGGGREIVLAKYENIRWETDDHTLRVPFPAGDGWVHVAFSVEGSLAQGNLFQQAQAQARLAVAGKCVSGLLWNDLMGTPFCAGIALGAPGVTVGQTFALTDPSPAMRDNPAYLARIRPKASPARAAAPEPWADFAFDGTFRPGGMVAGMTVARLLGAQQQYAPSPNGQALTNNPYCLWDMLDVASDDFTVTFVARLAPHDRAALLSLRNFLDTSWKAHGLLMVKSGKGGAEGNLTLDYLPHDRERGRVRGQLWLPVACDDAASAFHHYAITCEQGRLRVFLDGRAAPGEILMPPSDGAAPFRRVRTLSGFQAGQRMGGGYYSKGHALDNLAFWPRALTDGEIAADAGRFRLTGVARAASGVSAGGASGTGGAFAPAGASLALPSLPAGQPLPTAAARAEANAVLDELLEGETPQAADLIALLRDAEEDATRHELLRRAEQALLKERRFGDAFAVTDLRAAAFAGAVTDAESATLLKEALRSSAIREPDTALAYAQAALAFAQRHDRPGLVQQIETLTKQIERYLTKGKDHAAWRKTLAAARSSAQARAALADLRAKAKSGEPADLMALAEGLAVSGEWGEETLAAFIGCGDADLAAVAGEEAVAGEAPGAREALALADRWWEAAERVAGDKPRLAQALRAHAATLYACGKPAAVGLRVRLIERRIEEGNAR